MVVHGLGNIFIIFLMAFGSALFIISIVVETARRLCDKVVDKKNTE